MFCKSVCPSIRKYLLFFRKKRRSGSSSTIGDCVDAFDAVQHVLPQVSRDACLSALRATGGDSNAAIDYLVEQQVNVSESFGPKKWYSCMRLL